MSPAVRAVIEADRPLTEREVDWLVMQATVTALELATGMPRDAAEASGRRMADLCCPREEDEDRGRWPSH